MIGCVHAMGWGSEMLPFLVLFVRFTASGKGSKESNQVDGDGRGEYPLFLSRFFYGLFD